MKTHWEKTKYNRAKIQWHTEDPKEEGLYLVTYYGGDVEEILWAKKSSYLALKGKSKVAWWMPRGKVIAWAWPIKPYGG